MKTLFKAAIIASTSILMACGSADDDNTNADNGSQDSEYALIDATAGRAYLDLESGHAVNEDEQWHMSYQKYVGFSVNGGISGDGEVSVCIAHIPDGVYDADGNAVEAAFKALTRDNTQADFDAVTTASCADEFEEDSINVQIDMADWLAADYSAGTPAFSASTEATNGWIVRSATTDASENYTYARVKVSDVDYSAGVKRGITLESEAWDGSEFLTAVTSPELVFTDDRIYWDLESNTIVNADDDWDLSIVVDGRNWNIQVNGGVSGEGNAAVGTLNVDAATDVTDPASGNTADVYNYYSDSASSVLSGPGSYGALSYGVAGGHNMWPNFTTYLFKDGDRYFKAQVVSNYGEDGSAASGNLYVRYAEVTE